jgi:hypothetical protein
LTAGASEECSALDPQPAARSASDAKANAAHDVGAGLMRRPLVMEATVPRDRMRRNLDCANASIYRTRDGARRGTAAVATRDSRRCDRQEAAMTPKRLRRTGLALGVVFLWMAASAHAAGIATPPANCNSSFDAYDYTPAALNACGYRTFPLRAVTPIAGGGATYDYYVDGHRVRDYVAPTGFDGTAATAAQLDKYGLPPRPADLAAYGDWQRRVTHLHVPTPPPFIVESNAQADSVSSPNWSGYAVTGGSGSFTHAESWFYVPTFYSSRCSSNSEVTWAGIGGYGNTGLGQDGTAHNVPGFADGQAWWEVWPDVNMMPVQLGGHSGHEFDASTRRISGGYRFYMYDYYSGTTRTKDVSINDYAGNSAEAIAERPKIGSQLANLSNFKTMVFARSEANGSGLNNWSSGGGRHGVHMYNGGTQLASPGDIGSDGYFTDTQLSCN